MQLIAIYPGKGEYPSLACKYFKLDSHNYVRSFQMLPTENIQIRLL